MSLPYEHLPRPRFRCYDWKIFRAAPPSRIARASAARSALGAAVHRALPESRTQELTRERFNVPKRTDIHKILIIGSGPIVIGQACEFDYSGTQACKALREEGYEVVLVNSNPATIMTDPEMADRTYIEPMTLETSRRSSRSSSPMPCCRRWAARPG